jgi:hypothetical protein
MVMKRIFELVLKLTFIFILCPMGFLFLALTSRITEEQGSCLCITVFGMAVLFFFGCYREELIVAKMEIGRFQPVESFFRTFNC